MAYYPGISDEYASLALWAPLMDPAAAAAQSPAFIQQAIRYPGWQALRLRLKGLPLKERFRLLEEFHRRNEQLEARVAVVNYIYALKRGGMIDD